MRTASLILALLATALLQSADELQGALTSKRASSLCSVHWLPTARAPTVTYFVGVALPDTVLAGPGRVRETWGPGQGWPIYGQLVRVDTLDGARAGDIRNAFGQRGNRHVLIVPWDYDPGCAPLYWNGRGRWITLKRSGFYTVTPRASEDWVDGVPTFDAFMADFQPYPHGRNFRQGHRGTGALKTSPSLDPRELFDLYERLPLFEELDRRDSTAFARVFEWARDNPKLAVKFPAQRILQALDRRRRREF